MEEEAFDHNSLDNARHNSIEPMLGHRWSQSL